MEDEVKKKKMQQMDDDFEDDVAVWSSWNKSIILLYLFIWYHHQYEVNIFSNISE